ncbi:MAG: PfkB family carbohydrate kinase, partial [Alphaproteobacteria bacterium]|nr:PfkB family carbohydrate kinase [Alphaproteobacteria bacterium]
VFVRPGVPEAIAGELLPLADIATPNAFELGHLTGTGVPADTVAAVRAARQVIARGPTVVVVTSHIGSDTPAEAIDTLAVTATEAWRVRTPRLGLRFDGSGDTLAALFLARILDTASVPEALADAVSSLQPLLAATRSPRHLALVAALPLMRAPPERFPAEAV